MDRGKGKAQDAVSPYRNLDAEGLLGEPEAVVQPVGRRGPHGDDQRQLAAPALRVHGVLQR